MKITKMINAMVMGSIPLAPIAIINNSNTIVISQKQIINDIVRVSPQKFEHKNNMLLISHDNLMELLDSGKLLPSTVKKIDNFLCQYSLRSKQVFQVNL